MIYKWAFALLNVKNVIQILVDVVKHVENVHVNTVYVLNVPAIIVVVIAVVVMFVNVINIAVVAKKTKGRLRPPKFKNLILFILLKIEY